jgi:hypothetical protein
MQTNQVITFIKNNKYDDKYAADTEAVRWKQGYDVLCDGNLFQRKRENRPKNIPHSLNFRCEHHVTLKCAGSLTINIEDNSVNHFISHSVDERGEPIHPLVAPVALEVREMITGMKERCRTEDKTAKKIYHEEQAKLSANSNFTNEELASHLPLYRSLRPAMAKHQRKRGGSVRRRMAKSLEEVKIEGDDLLTIKKERWVVNVKSGNKIIVAVAPTGEDFTIFFNC